MPPPLIRNTINYPPQITRSRYMEQQPLPLLPSSSKSTPASSPPAEVPTPPPTASDSSRPCNNEGGSEIVKAKIMSHPLYPALLRSFIDCRKVGAPPEVVGRLSALAGEVKMNSSDRQEQREDPELDQFMEMYCHMLERYKHELATPIQEADDFFKDDHKSCELGGGGSSDHDEQEAVGDADGLPEISGEDKELKNRLLNKYSGYLDSLWRELSRKKKGKLPRAARQKLLHWWQMHYRWPYPSELEKAALAESTGLDAKQINNWFINQRKRHWKPAAPPMLATTDYRLHHNSGGASSSSTVHHAALRAEGQYFAGGSAYPRGP